LFTDRKLKVVRKNLQDGPTRLSIDQVSQDWIQFKLNDPSNFSPSTHKDLKSRLLRLGTAVAFQVAAEEDLQILRAMMPTFELNQDERTSASSKMKLWKDAAGRLATLFLRT
jgi:hypothetical protein